jgi:Ca2+-binding RTX toxin-like protein
MRRQTGSNRAILHQAKRAATRRLGCELLERRELLAVSLSGMQTVGAWLMGIDHEVLSQTTAQFTLSGGRAGASVTVAWGDGSASSQTILDRHRTALVTHTFPQGAFTVTVTCGAQATPYTFQSDTMALGHAANARRGSQALFIMGNALANQVSVETAGPGMIRATITNPSATRLVPSTITGIYGSLLEGNDSVAIQSTVTRPAFFCLGAGNDRFGGGAGSGIVFGEGGNDVIVGGPANDWLSGGDGNDCIYGGVGDDYIDGGNGDNMLFGGDGNDTICGGPGNDLIEGDAGNDRLFGNGGNDLLYGSQGNDYLDGGAGDDWLFGEDGKDTLLGGAGNDVCIGGAGEDQINGGAGNNILGGGFDFLLNLRRADALNGILTAWAVQGQIPQDLSDPNLKVWDDNIADQLVGGSGRNLFYTGRHDTVRGHVTAGADVKIAAPAPTGADVRIATPPPTADVRIATPAPTAADVAVIDYTTSSGVVNPSGSPGRTTTLLGRFYTPDGHPWDMQIIIGEKLMCRKTMDFSPRLRSFQVLNIPDPLWVSSAQFWADYNLRFLQAAVARNDVIMAMTTPSSGGGYGAECDYLTSQGYTYDPVSHEFRR